jgi:hypothetical protein
MPFTVEQASRFYRIECVDCEHSQGNWLLLGAGSGLMMAILDQEPRFRYCLDTDLLIRTADWLRMPSWLTLMEGACDRIAACGWFSRYENGLPLIDALSALTRRPLVYFGAYERPDLLAHCDAASDLTSFIMRLNALDKAKRKRKQRPAVAADDRPETRQNVF